MIPPGSRYQDSTIVYVTTLSGQLRPAVYANRFGLIRSLTFRYRTAVDGDRYDIIANREYGDARLWWVLARANPEVFYPEEIPVGAVLRIPDVTSLR